MLKGVFLPARENPFDAVEPVSNNFDLSGFDCGNPDFNDFIANDALRDSEDNYSVTYIGIIRGAPAAYVCLVAASYRTEAIGASASRRYRYRSIPAVKIARIATDRRYQRAGFGKALVAFSTSIARKVGELVGCRLLVTDALLERIPWYEELGFKLSLPSSMAHKRENYPMFFPLPSRR